MPGDYPQRPIKILKAKKPESFLDENLEGSGGGQAAEPAKEKSEKDLEREFKRIVKRSQESLDEDRARDAEFRRSKFGK